MQGKKNVTKAAIQAVNMTKTVYSFILLLPHFPFDLVFSLLR